MPIHCECRERHLHRKIVVTGGPGAGKTAVLEMIRHSLCEHVSIVPESAGIIFRGGFPRNENVGVLRAIQRAIFHVQSELEAAMIAEGAGIMICDRGAADGFAYWPGPDDFWSAVGAARDEVLRRYDAVIHLRVPDAMHGYGHQNPLRIEDPWAAKRIDERIVDAWTGHPNRTIVESSSNFLTKAVRTLEAIRNQLPRCCREHASEAIRSLNDKAKNR